MDQNQTGETTISSNRPPQGSQVANAPQPNGWTRQSRDANSRQDRERNSPELARTKSDDGWGGWGRRGGATEAARSESINDKLASRGDLGRGDFKNDSTTRNGTESRPWQGNHDRHSSAGIADAGSRDAGRGSNGSPKRDEKGGNRDNRNSYGVSMPRDSRRGENENRHRGQNQISYAPPRPDAGRNNHNGNGGYGYQNNPQFQGQRRHDNQGGNDRSNTPAFDRSASTASIPATHRDLNVPRGQDAVRQSHQNTFDKPDRSRDQRGGMEIQRPSIEAAPRGRDDRGSRGERPGNDHRDRIERPGGSDFRDRVEQRARVEIPVRDMRDRMEHRDSRERPNTERRESVDRRESMDRSDRPGGGRGKKGG